VARVEIVIEGGVVAHVIGGGEHRGGDGADGPLGAASGTQAMERRAVVGPLRARRPPRRIGSGWS
jgi:hypothetical protein